MMKKFFSLIIVVVFTVTAIFGIAGVAYAAGVELSISSDKDSLSEAGQVEFTATITNNSGALLSGYTIEYTCGESTNTVPSGEDIADGEEGTVVFTCDVSEDMLDQEITFSLLDSSGTELATAAKTIKTASELLMSGTDSVNVVLVQQRLRDLGYFNYRATGRFLSMTEKGVILFQESNALDIDGQIGPSTFEKLFSLDAVRSPLSPEIHVTSGPSLDGTPTNGELADWFTVIDPAFPVGETVTITDYNTGDTFQMTRTGGTNHAEVEPPNADEYDKYIDTFGGVPNWEKRSVLVTIGGTSYAASLFGNAQGEDTISDNTMAGHTCLYFYGSFSHVYGFSDKEHERMVLRAAGEPLKYKDE